MSKLKPAGDSGYCSQMGALPYRITAAGEIEVLLITSRASKRWIVPKGWPMKRRQPFEVAAQEALEEAGVRGWIDERPLGAYTYAKRLTGLWAVPCLVEVFALHVTELQAAWREDAQRSRAWFSTQKASLLVAEPELAAIIARFNPRLGSEGERTQKAA